MDEKLSDRIREIYHDPKVGFVGLPRLHRVLKKKGISVTHKALRRWLTDERQNQLFRIKTIKERFPINAPWVYSYQADLIFFKRKSRGFGIALTCVEISSKIAYVIPIKTKTFKDISRAFDKIPKLNFLRTDQGTEFVNKQVQKYFDERDIIHTTGEAGQHERMGLIERFNRTIKALIKRYMEQRNTTDWYSALPDLVSNYNSQPHAATGIPPEDMDEARMFKEMAKKRRIMKTLLKKLSVDPSDKVRLPIEKRLFDKEGVRWSRKVYTVDRVQGLGVRVRDSDGELHPRKWMPYELLLVRNVRRQPPDDKPIATEEADKKARADRRFRQEGIEKQEAPPSPRARPPPTKAKKKTKKRKKGPSIPSATYKKNDVVLFPEGYFKDEQGEGTPAVEGTIKKVYVQKSRRYYDVDFDGEVWKLEVKRVDGFVSRV